jgi:molecular chaperone GrpE
MNTRYQSPLPIVFFTPEGKGIPGIAVRQCDILTFLDKTCIFFLNNENWPGWAGNFVQAGPFENRETSVKTGPCFAVGKRGTSHQRRVAMSNHTKKLDEYAGTVAGENDGTVADAKMEYLETEAAARTDGESPGDTPNDTAVSGAGESQPENCADKKDCPQKKIEELERKLAEVTDQYLRKAAEFENFRKRITKEKQDAVEFANQSMLLELIATLDDFERAISSAGLSEKTEADFDAFRDGIIMVEKKLIGQLENKWGLKRFDSVGTPFDPERHEALLMEKSADVSEPVVQEDFARGYMLKDRVVRPAKVKVLMPETA